MFNRIEKINVDGLDSNGIFNIMSKEFDKYYIASKRDDRIVLEPCANKEWSIALFVTKIIPQILSGELDLVLLMD